jgi:DNA-binding response OmpR family regulator
MSQRRPQPRVFVVDDEPLIATSLSTILRHSGFDALAFTLPLEALKAAQTDAPDLLISDLLMPQLSGVELALEMQKLHPNCKVLLCSGQSSDRDLLSDAAAAGHEFEHMVKPVHPKDLLKRIHQVTGNSPSLPTVGELLAGL